MRGWQLQHPRRVLRLSGRRRGHGLALDRQISHGELIGHHSRRAGEQRGAQACEAGADHVAPARQPGGTDTVPRRPFWGEAMDLVGQENGKNKERARES